MNAQVRKAKSPMSSDQDISSLIADPHSDLSAFKPLLQIAPAWRNNEEKEEFLKLHVQMKELRARISQSLTPSEEAETGEQQEIVSYVDTLKRSSMIFFILGQYRECYEALTLLVEIEPDNLTAQHFLEITQRTLGERHADHDTSRDKVDGELKGQATHGILSSSPDSLESDGAANANAKAQPRKHWLAVACIGLILVGVLAGVWARLTSTTTLVIVSEPDSVNTFMNGHFVGKTPLQLQSVKAGDYGVRFEKEGYVPLVQQVAIKRGEPRLFSVQLKQLEANSDGLFSLREKAEALFGLGKLAEAGQICNTILQRNPQDRLALKLMEDIHNRSVAPAVHMDSGQGPRVPEASTLKVRDTASRSAPVSRPPKPPKESTKTLVLPEPGNHPPGAQSPGLNETARLSSLSGGFSPSEPPPSPIKQVAAPATSTPNNAVPQKLDRTGQDVVGQIQAKIQAKEFDQAKDLLSQLQKDSSAQLEWRLMTEKLRAEQTKQQALVFPWVQKAETALIAGRYITPPDDNVLLYCNRALAIDPRNQRATTLKKDIIGRSVAQAKEWIEGGRFDEARLFYSSLNYLSQNDDHFPLSRQELQQELVKLEFVSYPVIHQHKLGNCKGRLRMNGYVISYVPSESGSDGFSEKLKYVSIIDAGDELKLKVKDKSYRFELNTGQDKEASLKARKTLYEQLMGLLSSRG
ncbi:MAG TPA: PEGA domain-containing protein [Terriglobia bacterium]|nr:PEGA domain-containing protein [Terriglobia bacterium]